MMANGNHLVVFSLAEHTNMIQTDLINYIHLPKLILAMACGIGSYVETAGITQEKS